MEVFLILTPLRSWVEKYPPQLSSNKSHGPLNLSFTSEYHHWIHRSNIVVSIQPYLCEAYEDLRCPWFRKQTGDFEIPIKWTGSMCVPLALAPNTTVRHSLYFWNEVHLHCFLFHPFPSIFDSDHFDSTSRTHPDCKYCPMIIQLQFCESLLSVPNYDQSLRFNLSSNVRYGNTSDFHRPK